VIIISCPRFFYYAYFFVELKRIFVRFFNGKSKVAKVYILFSPNYIYGNLVADIDEAPYIWQPKNAASGIYICDIYKSNYRESRLLFFVR